MPRRPTRRNEPFLKRIRETRRNALRKLRQRERDNANNPTIIGESSQSQLVNQSHLGAPEPSSSPIQLVNQSHLGTPEPSSSPIQFVTPESTPLPLGTRGEPMIDGSNSIKFGEPMIIGSPIPSPKAVSFPITQDQLDSWVPCQPPSDNNNTDCIPSSLAFLGAITKEEYENASSILKYTRKGVNAETSLMVLPKCKYFENKSDITDFENLKKIIPKSYGTIVVVNPIVTGRFRHAVVLAHDINDNIILLDPQKHRQILQDDIQSWLDQYGFHNISTIPMKSPENSPDNSPDNSQKDHSGGSKNKKRTRTTRR